MRIARLRIAVLVAAVISALAAGAGVALAGAKAAPIGRGVVVVETNLAYQGAAAAGTGIVLDASGEVLTNNHVIAGATTVRVVLPGTGRTYSASVLGYSRTNDVAVLQLQGASNLKTLTLGTSRLAVGQAVTALGNAGGAGHLVTVTGRVTGLGKSITAADDQGGTEQLTGLIEMNAAIVPGDSGGPLLDRRGRVIGMDTAGSVGGFQDVAATDAYAIPIGRATAIAKQILAGQSSATVHVGDTPFVGIQVGSVDAGFGQPPAAGALVVGVVPNGPADAAGLVQGDVITALDGQAISSPADLPALILAQKPGATVTVGYTDPTGASATVTVTLGSGPPQ
jgi:S1-C subfamily serine protease